jgi:hypothetical protein
VARLLTEAASSSPKQGTKTQPKKNSAATKSDKHIPNAKKQNKLPTTQGIIGVEQFIRPGTIWGHAHGQGENLVGEYVQ